MPQKQTRTLTEDDVLTSQAREQAGGTVVYSAMNDLGDFYSGTKKLSSATGEEKVIDAPIITFTGDDAQGENQNRSSGIFDDVLVKERITIEGGENGNQSSQFYGPVNFTKKVTNTSDEGVNTKNLYIKGTAAQGKLITVGLGTPSSTEISSPNDGAISLRDKPTDSYIGQVYVDNKWKRFGLISDSADILDIKVDRLGIGDPSAFVNAGGVANAKLYVAGDIKLQNVTITGTTSFTSNVVLNDVNFDYINIKKAARFTGVGFTSTDPNYPYAIYVSSPNNDNDGIELKTRLYDLEVANDAYISGNLGIGTTNPGTKLRVVGDTQFDGNVRVGISTTSNYIAFRGTYLDDQTTYTHTYIGERIYESETERSELLLFKGNDIGAPGPDRIRLAAAEFRFDTYSFTSTAGTFEQVATSANITNKMILTGDGNLGIGTTNPTSKLVVNGTIGIDASSSTAGRTQLSSSATGFVVNHNHSSPITFQTQSIDRLRIGAGGTITGIANTTGTATAGSHLRLTNSGGGDSVISWDNTNGNANQRWYAGIDVSDGASWKLASPTSSNFNNENFDATGPTFTETKLKIDTSGNATFLGGLTLNTNKFIVAGATGNTTIAGSLNIGAGFNVNVSNENKFSVDTSGNVTNVGTLTATGKIKTFNDLEVTTSATVGTTLGVTGQVTAGSFKIKDATDVSLLLRASGVASALTKDEINAAVGFTVKESSTTSNLPNGNSISLYLDDANANQTNRFDGNRKTFPLKTVDNKAFTPISSANLLVSVGGVIQKPETDYTVSGSDIIFNWAPATGLSFFIIAFGGLGGLRQNQDWDGDKGTLLVGSATDNLGIKFPVGSNDQVLTVNLTKDSGLEWKVIPRDNLKTNPAWDAKGNLLVGTGADTADILAVSTSNGAILTADSSTTSGLAWKTTFTGNAATVTDGFYTTSSFNLGTTSIAVNRASGAQTLTGVSIDGSSASCTGNAATVTDGVYTTNFDGSLTGKGYQKLPGGLIMQWGRSNGRLGGNGGSQTQTFAIPFPTEVYSIQATPSDNVVPNGDKRDHWATSAHSLTGFTLHSWFETAPCAYSWFAVGV
jgi:hypothetical protein